MTNKTKATKTGNLAASQQQYRGNSTTKAAIVRFPLAAGVLARMKKKGVRHGKR
jgi:hypothetical protein